ncbi:MAG: hypothetical protein JO101_09720 [Candidatus Eremiobacteraeota bacterium]|nr:hypothetical protein [Candidatus Eremiobacteraeota bacterium]MBV8355587.1 hypothetical protein [Candidatus Eremiobacteraeota bacterium]
MGRLALHAGLLLFLVAASVGRVAAATQTVDVPKVDAAPPLDPAAAVAAWPATALSLTWDVVHAHAASEPTEVRIATDGRVLYLRFDARQHDPVVVSQHSDDVITGGSSGNQGSLSWSNDDAVWVDLWPTGPGGFLYQFESNPGGSHNESSSENAAFAPHWESRGIARDGGYVVTMAIPLEVIHGLHPGLWRAQFIRYARATGAEYVWSYDPAQNNPDSSARAGELTIPAVSVHAARPKPRVAPYALGSLAAPAAGGSTSRVGADASVPVSATAALFATLHPDYSNVELDQQSISPSVYQRVFSEVRPFFTQAASYYNNFNCDVCSGFRTTLYTPGIPTPSQGYAFEGKAGQLALAGFDAIGTHRVDAAGALDYISRDTRWQASLQHVTADVPGVVDDANEIGLNWSSLKYLSAYVNYSTDTGTSVLDSARGRAVDVGGGWANQHFAFFGSARKVGAYFNPIDGFDSHPDIAGYGVYLVRIWPFAPSSKLQSVGISGFLDRYQGTLYGQSQSDNSLALDVLTKSAWDLQLFSGSDYWRFGQTLEPISQNAGFNLTYHSGLQNNVGNFPAHGTSATPTELQYYTGRYGAGRLDTWLRTSTIRLGERGSLSLVLDDTAQWLPAGTDNIQWFEAVSYAFQIARNSSVALGVRRVVGFPPQPNGGGNCLGVCSNLSVAYHLRLHDAELFVAYGDPNTLVTVPQAIFKVIFYAGSQKGT